MKVNEAFRPPSSVVKSSQKAMNFVNESKEFLLSKLAGNKRMDKNFAASARESSGVKV